MSTLILRLERLPDDDGGETAGEAVAGRRLAEVRRLVEVASAEPDAEGPLDRWASAVAVSDDACLVVDLAGKVVSLSSAAADLLGCDLDAAGGQPVLELVDVVDLESGASSPAYATRITPLSVLRGPGLARSLMRVRHDDDTTVTVDSSSSPIHDTDGAVLGSVTFFAPVTG